MQIIVDRKHKRANFDNQWADPFSVELAKKEQARTIDVPKDDKNPIYEFIRKWGSHKLLLGKKVHCLTDRQTVLSGYIVDVIPPSYLLLKNKGVAKFSDVITIGE